MDLVSLDGRSKSSRPPSETDGSGSGKTEEGGAASNTLHERGAQNGDAQATSSGFRERAGEAALRPLEGWRLGGVTTA